MRKRNKHHTSAQIAASEVIYQRRLADIWNTYHHHGVFFNLQKKWHGKKITLIKAVHDELEERQNVLASFLLKRSDDSISCLTNGKIWNLLTHFDWHVRKSKLCFKKWPFLSWDLSDPSNLWTKPSARRCFAGFQHPQVFVPLRRTNPSYSRWVSAA